MKDKDRNEKPHLLTARIEHYGPASRYSNIRWSVECPYGPDDPRDCSLIEECFGSERDVAKHGCRPYPDEPPFPKGHNPEDDLPEDYRLAFLAWEDDVEEWKDEHVRYNGGSAGHRLGGQCWFTYILEHGDVDPDYILTGIPEGTIINSPLPVSVYYDGSYDEPEPNFSLWKEAANGDPS